MCSDFEVPTSGDLRRETVSYSELQPDVTRICTTCRISNNMVHSILWLWEVTSSREENPKENPSTTIPRRNESSHIIKEIIMWTDMIAYFLKAIAIKKSALKS